MAVDVEGVTLCEQTPCKIEVPARCDPSFGPPMDYVLVTASPLKDGYTQSKRVNKCQINDGQSAVIRFDPRLRPDEHQNINLNLSPNK